MTEKEKRTDRKNKDRFSVTLIGVVIYSVVLIGVMVASYMGVKAILINHDRMMDITEEMPEEIAENVPEESETPTPTPTPVPESEPVEEEIDHEVSPDELMDPETGIVDYSVVHFKPGKRNKDLK